jgi:hypothetical protein
LSSGPRRRPGGRRRPALVEGRRETTRQALPSDRATEMAGPGGGRPGRVVRVSTDGEACQALRGFRLDLDASYMGVSRALVTPLDELVDRLGIAFGHHFDPAVGEVASPARDTEGARLVRAAASVPNPLDPPAYPEMAAHHTTGQSSPGHGPAPVVGFPCQTWLTPAGAIARAPRGRRRRD